MRDDGMAGRRDERPRETQSPGAVRPVVPPSRRPASRNFISTCYPYIFTGQHVSNPDSSSFMGTVTGTERSDRSERPAGAEQLQSRPPRAARGERPGRGVLVDLDARPSYLAAAITAAVVLGLYLITLAPSTAMWDTSEYIAA